MLITVTSWSTVSFAFSVYSFSAFFIQLLDRQEKEANIFFSHKVLCLSRQGAFKVSGVSAWSGNDCDVYTFSAGTPDRLESEVHRSEM